jgi:hypothetical protein
LRVRLVQWYSMLNPDVVETAQSAMCVARQVNAESKNDRL